MDSSILKIATLLNNPRLIDGNKRYIKFESDNQNVFFILDYEIIKRVLKDDRFLPNNFFESWLAFNRVGNESFPALTDYFKNTPLVQHAIPHSVARDSLKNIYHKVQFDLQDWLDTFSVDFFSDKTTLEHLDAWQLSAKYVDEVYQNIFANQLGISKDDITISNGGDIFLFAPNARQLTAYEAFFSQYIKVASDALTKKYGNTDDLWPLATILVMGRDPLVATLTYYCVHHNLFAGLDGSKTEQILRMISPVSMTTRLAGENLLFEDLLIKQGDVMQLSIYTSQVYSEAKELASISFGHGKHVCPGRALSNMILKSFIENISAEMNKISSDKIGFRREISLYPKRLK